MTPEELSYWIALLESLARNRPAKEHIRAIVASPAYTALSTDGKITLMIMIFGHVRFA